MTAVILNEVKKNYGTEAAIHNANLRIESGEFVVFVGPSGCGKSTLLRIIAGLEDLTSGTLHIGEKNVSYAPPGERGVAMVFQSYALYPHMTTKQNLSFGLRMNKVAADEIDRRVDRAIKILHLEKYLERKPSQMSGGQCQRVAIGRAIVQEPEVFLFDEPLSNLDAELRVNMRAEIASLHRQLGNTMIYVTHDQVEAMTLADRIVVLRDGNIEQIGSPLEIYRAPKNTFVAEFIGTPKINLLDAKVKECNDANNIKIKLTNDIDLSLSVPQHALNVGDKVTLGLRPTNIKLSDNKQIEVTIDYIEQLGGSNHIFGHFGEDTIRFELKDAATLKKDDTVSIEFDLSDALLFDSNGNAIG